jgi:hypothetical protein
MRTEIFSGYTEDPYGYGYVYVEVVKDVEDGKTYFSFWENGDIQDGIDATREAFAKHYFGGFYYIKNDINIDRPMSIDEVWPLEA